MPRTGNVISACRSAINSHDAFARINFTHDIVHVAHDVGHEDRAE